MNKRGNCYLFCYAEKGENLMLVYAVIRFFSTVYLLNFVPPVCVEDSVIFSFRSIHSDICVFTWKWNHSAPSFWLRTTEGFRNRH